MLLDDYQAEAQRTAPRSLDAYPDVVRQAAALLDRHGPYTGEPLLKLQDVHIWAHGLAGEAGEVCDLLKKVHGHGKPYDRSNLLKELGDCLWYLANLASAHGMTLSEVARANVDKLRARYPGGFTVAAAAAKADERCTVPPPGWVCTRARGHEGPCAAHLENRGVEKVTFKPCRWDTRETTHGTPRYCNLPVEGSGEYGFCEYHNHTAAASEWDAGPAPGKVNEAKPALEHFLTCDFCGKLTVKTGIVHHAPSGINQCNSCAHPHPLNAKAVEDRFAGLRAECVAGGCLGLGDRKGCSSMHHVHGICFRFANHEGPHAKLGDGPKDDPITWGSE